MHSLDPRVNRLELSKFEQQNANLIQPLEHFQTYEVFTQKVRGAQHVHVGIVHAPSSEMALLFAKEQYARREQCVNIWVVKSVDVQATSYEDSTMFEHAFDKSYRESFGYKVRDLIDTLKKDSKTNKNILIQKKAGTNGKVLVISRV